MWNIRTVPDCNLPHEDIPMFNFLNIGADLLFNKECKNFCLWKNWILQKVLRLVYLKIPIKKQAHFQLRFDLTFQYFKELKSISIFKLKYNIWYDMIIFEIIKLFLNISVLRWYNILFKLQYQFLRRYDDFWSLLSVIKMKYHDMSYHDNYWLSLHRLPTSWLAFNENHSVTSWKLSLHY